MTTMLRWSPTRQFHFHHPVDAVFPRLFDGATPEAAPRDPSWSPAVDGLIENGTFVIQLSLPGVDPKDVTVSLMDYVLTVTGERKADRDTTDKDYFVREVASGAFQRSFELPEGVDAAHVEATHAHGLLEAGRQDPSFSTINALAKALGVPVTARLE